MTINPIIHLAVADDYELIRKGLRYSIATFGNCIIDIEAEDGLELIEKILAAERKPDICLLDISMPRMDGYKALVEIKKQWPEIKVIILTVHYVEYAIIKTLRDGAACCLPKEVNDLELKKAISQVHSEGFYYNDEVSKYFSTSLREDSKKIKLTENELTFLRHCCTDFSYKEIAEKMEVSPRTIDSYRDSLFEKLGVKTRTSLVVFALQTGIKPVANVL